MSVRVTFLCGGEAHVNREYAEVPAVGDLVEISEGSVFVVVSRHWRKPVDIFSTVDVHVEPVTPGATLPRVGTSKRFPGIPSPTGKVPEKRRKR